MSNEKTNKYDMVKRFVEVVYSSITSPAGKINLTLSFLLVVVIAFLTRVPALSYILQMVQFICNTVLSLFEKPTLPVKNTGDDMTIFIICIIALFLEFILCPIMVHFSEKNKGILQKSMSKDEADN